MVIKGSLAIQRYSYPQISLLQWGGDPGGGHGGGQTGKMQ